MRITDVVHFATYLDGCLHAEHAERRSIQVTKDGAHKVKVLRGWRPIKRDPNGRWLCEIHVKTLKVSTTMRFPAIAIR